MRFQDELLSLYPTQAWQNQKFILWEVDTLARSFDSEELLGFLKAQLFHPNASVRQQAQMSFALFQPTYMMKRYAVVDHQPGVWTRKVSVPSMNSMKADLLDAVDGDSLRKKALRALDPIAVVLNERVSDRSERVRHMARLALAQIPTESVQKQLGAALRSSPRDFGLLLAYARSGGGTGSDGALAQFLTETGLANPNHLLVAATLARVPMAKLIADLAGRLGDLGRSNLAQAVGYAAQVDAAEVIAPLLATPDPWVDVFCLRALASSRSRANLEAIIALFGRARSDFGAAHAVRAAAAIGGQPSLELCLRALSSGSDRLKAQALESLVVLGCPQGPLETAAAPLLNSDHVRVRANALLALSPWATKRVPDPLRELVLSPSGYHRMEAAYCLGFYRSDESLACLEHLATQDDGSVAVQAAKSMAKYPASEAVPVLLSVLRSRQDEVGLAAARVLTHFPDDQSALVVDALVELRKRKIHPFVGSLVLRSLGLLGCRLNMPDLATHLNAGLTHESTDVILGALEGWKVLARVHDGPVDPAVTALRSHADPRVSSRALVVSFLLGDSESARTLADRVDIGSESVRLRSLEACLELGVIVAEVVHRGGFRALRRGLESTVPLAAGDMSQPWTLLEARRRMLVESMAAKRSDLGLSDLVAPGPPRAPEAALETRPDVPAVSPVSASAVLRRPPSANASQPSLTAELTKSGMVRKADAGLARAIRQGTYLLDDQAPGSSERLWAALAAVPPHVRTLAAAAALTLVLAIVGIGMRSGTGGPSAVAAPRPQAVAFTLSRLSGRATVTGQERPLEVGDSLVEGQTLEVQGKVTLMSATGGTLSLDAGSMVKATKVSTDGLQLSLELETPGARFDFSAGGAASVRLGGHGVAVNRAVLQVTRGSTGTRLECLGGTVEVDGQPVAPGSARDL